MRKNVVIIAGTILITLFVVLIVWVLPFPARQVHRLARATRVGTSIAVNAASCSVVLIPAPGVAKARWNPAQDVNQPLLAAFLPASLSTGTTTRVVVLQDHRRTFPKGRLTGVKDVSLYSRNSFDSGLGILTFAFNGIARADWLGKLPFEADQIGLFEAYSVTGFDVNASYPSDAGFSRQGNTVTWTTTQHSHWGVFHRFSGCPAFRTLGILSNVSETAVASIQVGSTFYTIGAQDSTSL